MKRLSPASPSLPFLSPAAVARMKINFINIGQA